MQKFTTIANQNCKRKAGINQPFFKPVVKPQSFFQPKHFPAIPVQRKCAECNEEENVRRNDADGLSTGIIAPMIVQDTIKSAGQPLDTHTRNFMESRFGYDFADVQIHNDSSAFQSCSEINALAYTNHNHIVFGKNQFQPDTNSGKQLLAHELTHVIQQRAMNGRGKIQRMKIGEAPAAKFSAQNGDVQLEIVPGDEAKKINSAITMVRDIVNDDGLQNCHDFYKENCPNKKTMKQTFDEALIWKYPFDSSELAGAHTLVDSPHIAYTYVSYKKNDAKGMAGILLHEMMHCCGITGPDMHSLADKAKLYCLERKNQFSVGFGKQNDLGTAIFSYRYFLRQLALGKITPTVGADLDLRGLDQGNLFSVMAGAQYRSNLLWGGEEFGGLTFGAGIGLSAGKFRKMEDSELADIGWGSGIVLELKTGAEFAIPDFTRSGEGSEGRQMAFFVQGSYRWIKPINSQAENIQEYSIAAGFAF